MELVKSDLWDKILEDKSTAGHMPIEQLNLKISEREIDNYQKQLLAHYDLAQAIYSTDLKIIKGNLLEIKAKLDSLRRSWKAFHQDWANIRRFNQMVWTHNAKATTLAIKMLHTTQILRVLEDPISLGGGVKP